MKRGSSGEFVTISNVGEMCRAFVPNPLPPQPPLVWSAELQAQFAAANTALGRLDGIAALLPDTSIFLYPELRS